MSRISKEALLDKAKESVADRGLNYGAPEDNFRNIARRWTAHLQNRGLFTGTQHVEPFDVAIMCADIKLARVGNMPAHLDSWVDTAGYAACGANIMCEDPTK